MNFMQTASRWPDRYLLTSDGRLIQYRKFLFPLCSDLTKFHTLSSVTTSHYPWCVSLHTFISHFFVWYYQTMANSYENAALSKLYNQQIQTLVRSSRFCHTLFNGLKYNTIFKKQYSDGSLLSESKP